MPDLAKRIQAALVKSLTVRVKELQKEGHTKSATKSRIVAHRLAECKYLLARIGNADTYKAIASIIETELKGGIEVMEIVRVLGYE